MNGLYQIQSSLLRELKNLATDPEAVTYFHVTSSAQCRYGSDLRLWLGNVNDEAVVQYGGIIRTVRMGGQALDERVKAQPRGQNFAWLICRNAPFGTDWKVRMAIQDMSTGGTIIDIQQSGDDKYWPSGRIRVYRCSFFVA